MPVPARGRLKAIQPENLTAALRRCGLLDGGRVTSVESETLPTLISRVMRLRLRYEGASDAPASIIFKAGISGRTGGLWEAGFAEVRFYRELAGAVSPPLAPRCFEAVWEADTKEWHLLLEDLDPSHELATPWPLPPSEIQCEQILRTLARFHAQWWSDPRLGVSIGTWPTEQAVKQQLQAGSARFASFVDRLGDRLTRERRTVYERYFEAAPRLRTRVINQPNLTVVHGDTHVWNFLVPRNGGDDVRMFDWDTWRPGLASSDLAYMMALHWYPDRRRHLERRLIDHYHTALLARGVLGYDRHALSDDYRLSVLFLIMVPVFQAAIDLPAAVWWSHFERIMLAVEDLGCRELLD